jgi:hypothetical protein
MYRPTGIRSHRYRPARAGFALFAASDGFFGAFVGVEPFPRGAYPPLLRRGASFFAIPSS